MLKPASFSEVGLTDVQFGASAHNADYCMLPSVIYLCCVFYPLCCFRFALPPFFSSRAHIQLPLQKLPRDTQAVEISRLSSNFFIVLHNIHVITRDDIGKNLITPY